MPTLEPVVLSLSVEKVLKEKKTCRAEKNLIPDIKGPFQLDIQLEYFRLEKDQNDDLTFLSATNLVMMEKGRSPMGGLMSTSRLWGPGFGAWGH